MEPDTIEIKNAREHNLQSVSLSLPRNALICFTGVSGSGKSSLAFDTLYAEGQRRYIESLSSYARQFMGQMQKPDCDLITGLSPSIAIQQKTTGWNPRSTVGTVTAIHDFLRVLYARVGVQHCTQCDRPISAQTSEQIVAGILSHFGGVDAAQARAGGDERKRESNRVLILAPVARGQKGEFRDLFEDLIRAGFVRARVDGEVVALTDDLALEKNQRHDIEVVVDRLAVSAESRSRIAEAVQSALGVGKGTLVVAPMEASPADAANSPQAGDDVAGAAKRRKKSSRRKANSGPAGGASTASPTPERIYSSQYACTACGISFEPPSPQLFSFNSPAGMCHGCDGLGELFDFDPELLVPDPSLGFLAPCIAPMRTAPGKWRRHIYDGVAKAVGFDLRLPWKDLPKKARDALLYGTGDRHITFTWGWSGGAWKHGGTFEGVIAELRDKYRKAKAGFVRSYYEKYMRRGPCPDCRGAKLNVQATAVRLPLAGGADDSTGKTASRRRTAAGRGAGLRRSRSKASGASVPIASPNIVELCSMSVAEAYEAIGRLALSPVQRIIAEEVLKEVRARLEFLLNVGLHYLSLDRSAPSLSGGELQRIRLAGQIGSGLVGVLYVLDEPSIGLHPRDNRKLLESLERLRDMGNTVIVVEHDEETMRAADYIVDFGPGPGVRGGEVVAAGDFETILAEDRSITGQYLSGGREIEVPKARRPVTRGPAAENSMKPKRPRRRGKS